MAKKGKKSKRGKSRAAKRRYQKEQLIRRVKDSQKQAEGGGLSILKPDVDVKVWRPNDGSHIIDIIPYKTGKMNVEGEKPGTVHYTFHYYIHKGVGPNNDWYICPARTWGDPCPICEHRAKLLDQGADYDSKIAPLNTKERNLYNVICWDKDQEKKGVQVWDVSFHYFEKHIIALSKKPARGGRPEKTIVFFDEEDGKSIAFTVEPAKSKEDYPSYVGHSFDDRDYEIDGDILDSAHCLDELVHKPTYEELEKAFWGAKSPGSTDDDDDDDGDDGDGRLEELLEELEDCDDLDELKEFCDDNDIDFDPVGKGSKAMKKNKKKIAKLVEAEFEDDDEDDDEDDEITEDDLDEMDKDELLEFCEDNDLEPPKKVKKKIKKLLKWIKDNYDFDEDDDDDDDEDEDDLTDEDEDEGEDEEDEEDERKSKRKNKGKKGKEKKGKGKKPKYSVDDIEEMNKRQLKKLIKKEDLDVDPDEADDLDDLQDMVMEELGIDDD